MDWTGISAIKWSWAVMAVNCHISTISGHLNIGECLAYLKLDLMVGIREGEEGGV